jgi:ABC-type branched-subunit amino acid transport system ATPase component
MGSLECIGLSKSFGGIVALTDVSLSLPESGIIALIGPNGSGKTTLLNLITGFDFPDSGHIVFGGKDITGASAYRIARLGITRTFQEVRLIHGISVLNNVLLARPNRYEESFWRAVLQLGTQDDRHAGLIEARNIIERVGLIGSSYVLAGELSYGQQKLATLACSVAAQSRVVLLDEPASGLSLEAITQTLTILEELKKQGKLVVIVEHDLEVVKRIADDVIVMNRGAIIARGKPNVVLAQRNVLEAYIE